MLLRDLAPYLEWYLSERLKRKTDYTGRCSVADADFCVFVDFWSLFQDEPCAKATNGMAGATNGKAKATNGKAKATKGKQNPVDAPCKCDPCTKGKRSSEEAQAFGRALARMDEWYGHAGTVSLLLTKPPEEWTLERTYIERGWPTFERSVSSLIKKAAHCLDFGAVPNLTFKGKFAEKQAKTLLTQAEGKGVSGGCKLTQLVRNTRLTPQTDRAFAELVGKCRFSSASDAERVPMLYAKVLRAVMGDKGAASSLSYSFVSWNAQQFGTLAETLGLSDNLKELRLLNAGMDAEGADAFFTDITTRGSLPQLQLLYLNLNNALALCEPAAKALCEGALPNLEILRLHNANLPIRTIRDCEEEVLDLYAPLSCTLSDADVVLILRLLSYSEWQRMSARADEDRRSAQDAAEFEAAALRHTLEKEGEILRVVDSAVVALSLEGRRREKRLTAEREARKRLQRKKRLTVLELGLESIGEAGIAALKIAGGPLPGLCNQPTQLTLNQHCWPSTNTAEVEAVQSGVLPGLEELRLHVPSSMVDHGSHIAATKLGETRQIDILVEPRANFGERLDALLDELADAGSDSDAGG